MHWVRRVHIDLPEPCDSDVVGRTLEYALRLETINAFSSLDDFREARERLTKQITRTANYSDCKFRCRHFLPVICGVSRTVRNYGYTAQREIIGSGNKRSI